MNLLSYIQGRRKGKEAHRIEKNAMQDPFLADALEGFDTVPGDHAKVIGQLQQLVKDQSQPKKRNILLWTSIAANIALLVGIGWYLMVQETPQIQQALSESAPVQDKPDSLKKLETIAMAELEKQDSRDTEQSEKKIQREPAPPPVIPEIATAEDAVSETYTETVFADIVPRATAIAPAKLEMRQIDSVIGITPKELQIPTESLQDQIAGRVMIRGISAKQSSRRIHGKVVDEIGEPLPGVNIATKDRKVGTTTDQSGEFSLDVDTNATLTANFIGYETQNIKADTTQMLIAMHESTQQLEEVVVVAFGRQKKANTISSISAIESKELDPNSRKAVPEPTIGKRAYKRYLEKNLIRPVDEDCAGVKGMVVIRFNVDAQGRPYNLQVTQKLCDTADREAMRLISEGCNWTQGSTEATVTVEF